MQNSPNERKGVATAIVVAVDSGSVPAFCAVVGVLCAVGGTVGAVVAPAVSVALSVRASGVVIVVVGGLVAIVI